MPDPLARQLLDPGNGSAAQSLMVGVLLTWNATTFANTIRVGTAVFENVSVVDPPGMTAYTLPTMCLVAMTPAGPVCLGLLRRFGDLTD